MKVALSSSKVQRSSQASRPLKIQEACSFTTSGTECPVMQHHILMAQCPQRIAVCMEHETRLFLWNETSFNHNAFYASKKCLYFINPLADIYIYIYIYTHSVQCDAQNDKVIQINMCTSAVRQPPFKFWFSADHYGHLIPLTKG